jgi:hypothetical protein
MNNILTDISDYLSSGGVSNISKSRMPPTPDSSVTLYQTGGTGAVKAMNGTRCLEHLRVQAKVRAATYVTASQAAQSIYEKLDGGLRGRFINGVTYEWAEAVHAPTQLPDDESGRAMLVLNFDVYRAAST